MKITMEVTADKGVMKLEMPNGKVYEEEWEVVNGKGYLLVTQSIDDQLSEKFDLDEVREIDFRIDEIMQYIEELECATEEVK